MQKTGKTSLQMFVYFIFDGNFICRFLYIFRPSSVPRSHFRHSKTKAFILIISDLYLQIVTSASANDTQVYNYQVNDTCLYDAPMVLYQIILASLIGQRLVGFFLSHLRTQRDRPAVFTKCFLISRAKLHIFGQISKCFM